MSEVPSPAVTQPNPPPIVIQQMPPQPFWTRRLALSLIWHGAIERRCLGAAQRQHPGSVALLPAFPAARRCRSHRLAGGGKCCAAAPPVNFAPVSLSSFPGFGDFAAFV